MPPITQTPLPPKTPFPTPLLRLKFQNLSAKGSVLFLESVPVPSILQDAVNQVIALLYPTSTNWIPVRSITLVLESFGGVAYTTGKRIDDDHKEIHLSTDYVAQISPSRVAEEITGVIVHEMVHCWQHNGKGTCPGGLIEGIADWVRLKAGHAPPHWKRQVNDGWDTGYQTTGFFLDWLEETRVEGAVVKINESLRETRYDEEDFWRGLFGKRVEVLWKEYGKWLDRGEGGGEGGVESEEVESKED